MTEKSRRGRLAALCLTALMILTACSAQKKEGAQLDLGNPTTVTVWHYYNGIQQIAFDQLVEQFNESVGKEKGIFVEAYSKGSVNELEGSVLAVFGKDAGTEPPDMFSSYADTAYVIEQMGRLADLGKYLTAEELAEYVDSFVDEGRIGPNGELHIFPIAKSSEVFMLSSEAWEAFAAATGTELEELETIEGLVRAAQAYYEWTDSLTPDVLNDGHAFFGRDAMANLFIVGSMQFGVELFKVQDGKVTLQIDENVMRKIWDTYYVPYIRGYFSAYSRFRSDDVKLGEIVAYVGSTSSANYFPDEVENESGRQEIGYFILPTPVFESGRRYAVQQGAGMVVTKSTPEKELAAATFLKWFTQDENNLVFGCASGYVPVKKTALSKELMDETIKKNSMSIAPKTYAAVVTCMNVMQKDALYTNKAFERGADARRVLENHLAQKATADREAVKARLADGMALEEATADMESDEAFAAWLRDFAEALEDAVK